MFLSALEAGYLVREAAATCGVSVATLYDYRKADAEFREAWQEAYMAGGDALALEARRRAVDGTVKPVFHQGEICGGIREYSDTLLIMLMKARNPFLYCDRARTLAIEWDKLARDAAQGLVDPTAHGDALEAIKMLENMAAEKASLAIEGSATEIKEDAPCPTDGG